MAKRGAGWRHRGHTCSGYAALERSAPHRASMSGELLSTAERYEVLKTLGKGAYGVVALAKDKESNELVSSRPGEHDVGFTASLHAKGTGEQSERAAAQVAIKFIERSEVAKHQKHVRREVVNHSSLLHPHVSARPHSLCSRTGCQSWRRGPPKCLLA